MSVVSVWADISLIWLCFLTLLAVVPVGVIFFFAIRGMNRLRQLCKLYLPIAQEKTRLVASKTEEISHMVASPIISVNAKAAQVNGLRKAVLRRKST